MSLWATGTLALLERALDVASLRQRLLADNIANVETPGYRRKDVSFSFHFQRALAGKVTHPAHIPIAPLPRDKQVITRQGTLGRNDGNNVDIELEMAELVKNSLYYQALLRQTSQYLVNLKRVISEGRR